MSAPSDLTSNTQLPSSSAGSVCGDEHPVKGSAVSGGRGYEHSNVAFTSGFENAKVGVLSLGGPSGPETIVVVCAAAPATGPTRQAATTTAQHNKMREQNVVK